MAYVYSDDWLYCSWPVTDKWLHTTPWIMIVGMVLGVGLTAILIRDQMKKVRK